MLESVEVACHISKQEDIVAMKPSAISVPPAPPVHLEGDSGLRKTGYWPWVLIRGMISIELLCLPIHRKHQIL